MSDKEKINALDANVAAAINSGNAAAAADCYANDAALLPPGAPRMDGRDAARTFWQGAIDAGLGSVTITSDSLDILGDTGITVGSLSGEMGGQALAGKYIVISRKTDDGWKIQSDIWNFDA